MEGFVAHHDRQSATACVLEAEGEDWWVEVGPVDLDAEIVTIQRQNQLVAALSRRPDGRLRIASYRGLDLRAVLLVRNLSRKPHPQQGVALRRDNWDYALDCSALLPSHSSAEAGFSHLSYWRTGIGYGHEWQVVPLWRAQRERVPRAAHLTVAELCAGDVMS